MEKLEIEEGQDVAAILGDATTGGAASNDHTAPLGLSPITASEAVRHSALDMIRRLRRTCLNVEAHPAESPNDEYKQLPKREGLCDPCYQRALHERNHARKRQAYR